VEGGREGWELRATEKGGAHMKNLKVYNVSNRGEGRAVLSMP
jgi:hypothetical protein